MEVTGWDGGMEGDSVNWCSDGDNIPGEKPALLENPVSR